MSFQKPATQKAHFAKKRAGIRTKERHAKDEARRRDGRRCRIPHVHRGALHVTHYEDKGMGGDKDGTRSDPSVLICACYGGHLGTRSIHSKHVRIIPLTDRLMNGPCRFEARESVGSGFGPWRVLGVEVEVGVLIS